MHIITVFTPVICVVRLHTLVICTIALFTPVPFVKTMFVFLQGLVEDNFLVVVNTDDKSLYQIDLSDGTSWKLPLTEMVYPVGVAYNPVDARVYWTDVRADNIKRTYLNGTEEEVVAILSSGDIC